MTALSGDGGRPGDPVVDGRSIGEQPERQRRVLLESALDSHGDGFEDLGFQCWLVSHVVRGSSRTSTSPASAHRSCTRPARSRLRPAAASGGRANRRAGGRAASPLLDVAGRESRPVTLCHEWFPYFMGRPAAENGG